MSIARKLTRILRHLFTTRWSARRCFPPEVLAQIEAAIAEVESRHAGEVRFVVESALDLPELWTGETPRERALEWFGRLGVWDTEANDGVLIYVLLADHDVEILADRGIARRVPPEDWEAVCHEMEEHYRAGRFAEGSVAGIRAVGRLLAKHFPGSRPDPNELPNQPVLL
ncbi:MAG: TPM domain-containing protein [Pseudomonadota bacterium]|jgi:Predicted membrane protein|nr:MAG: hypothetical protein DIU56_01665 [Pseudomonadota bacterium]